jgi:PAS domain S-box-containing protein
VPNTLAKAVLVARLQKNRAFADDLQERTRRSMPNISTPQSIPDNERDMLRALIDHVPDFMYVKDRQGRFLIVNAHTAKAFGAKGVDDMLGKTDFDYFPKDLASAFHANEQAIMDSGHPVHNREEQSIIAGNKIDILSTRVPLRDSKGRVIGIAVIGRDVTEHKRTEDALREAERNYRGIFDDAMVGMFQSTPTGRFLNVNPAMARIFGFDSPEEMVENVTNISQQLYVEPTRHAEFLTAMDRLGSILSLECEVFRKDGSKIWIETSGRAVRTNRQVVSYEGIAEDITERIMMRAHLFQSQKLESVWQLAAGIAHEINTPTQYIGDNVRFLKDAFQDIKRLMTTYAGLLTSAKANDLSPEALQNIVATVEKANVIYLFEEIPKAIEQTLEGIARVSKIVSAMKEFSHPGTKEKVPLDINHAIESTITVARSEWKYVADMETDLDPKLPLISCLPGEFNQVILNLIVNAAHAIADVVSKGASEKGLIRIQTRFIENSAEIRIQDSGTGIPEKVQARIFDPFFTTKEIGKGTGQGLAIARSAVVDKHGGTLRFETEEGKGTTFIIRLPHGTPALAATTTSA